MGPLLRLITICLALYPSALAANNGTRFRSKNLWPGVAKVHPDLPHLNRATIESHLKSLHDNIALQRVYKPDETKTECHPLAKTKITLINAEGSTPHKPGKYPGPSRNMVSSPSELEQLIFLYYINGGHCGSVKLERGPVVTAGWLGFGRKVKYEWYPPVWEENPFTGGQTGMTLAEVQQEVKIDTAGAWESAKSNIDGLKSFEHMQLYRLSKDVEPYYRFKDFDIGKQEEPLAWINIGATSGKKIASYTPRRG